MYKWIGIGVAGVCMAIAGCTPQKPPPSSASTAAAPKAEATPKAETAPKPEATPPVEPAKPSGDSAGSGQVRAPMTPAAAELAAYKKALPVFTKHCSGCHTSKKGRKKKAWKHFTMNSYPFGGHHANEIGKEIRKSLGVGGGKATMPRDDPGAVKGAELALIVAWSRAFDKTHPTKPRGHHHGHKKRHKKRHKKHKH